MITINDLPIGARICENKSGTVFIIADHHHTGWQGTCVVADKVCLISCLDAAEPDNPDEAMAKSGCNRYRFSNINQWLNSSEQCWYRPQHEYDAPCREELISMRQDVFGSKLFDPDGTFPGPYSYEKLPGYLSRFSDHFCEAILTTPVPCFGPNDPDIIHYGPPAAEIVDCRAFLFSAAEMGLEDEVRWEGYLVRLFLDPRMRMCAPENAALHRDASFDYKQSAVALWLRSPLGGTSHMGKIYQAEHKFGDVAGVCMMPHPVNYAAGIRPAMNLDNNLKITGRDENGIYSIES